MWPIILSLDYVFVTPVEVDADGGYLTHDVSRRGHRSRRSLSPSLHYRLSAFGQDMILDLQPSSVVGPGFTVQTLGSEGITTATGDTGFHSCLYQGFVRNLSASSAAISTCSGLVGNFLFQFFHCNVLLFLMGMLLNTLYITFLSQTANVIVLGPTSASCLYVLNGLWPRRTTLFWHIIVCALQSLRLLWTHSKMISLPKSVSITFLSFVKRFFELLEEQKRRENESIIG